MSPEPRPLRCRSVPAGSIRRCLSNSSAVSLCKDALQQSATRTLRRLRLHNPLPRNGRRHDRSMRRPLHLLDGVHGGQAHDRRAMFSDRIDGPLDGAGSIRGRAASCTSTTSSSLQPFSETSRASALLTPTVGVDRRLPPHAPCFPSAYCVNWACTRSISVPTHCHIDGFHALAPPGTRAGSAPARAHRQ